MNNDSKVINMLSDNDIKKAIIEYDNNILVQNLLTTPGCYVLNGASGCRKTNFAIQLCDSILMGKPFLGNDTQKNAVAYFDTEMNDEELVIRFCRDSLFFISDYKEIRDEGLYCEIDDKPVSRFYHHSLDDFNLDKLENFINNYGDKFKLIVVDVITDLDEFQEHSNANDYYFLRPLFRKMNNIAKRKNIYLLVLNHTKADGSSRGADGIKGSVTGQFRIELTSKENQEYILHSEKVKFSLVKNINFKCLDDSSLEPIDSLSVGIAPELNIIYTALLKKYNNTKGGNLINHYDGNGKVYLQLKCGELVAAFKDGKYSCQKIGLMLSNESNIEALKKQGLFIKTIPATSSTHPNKYYFFYDEDKDLSKVNTSSSINNYSSVNEQLQEESGNKDKNIKIKDTLEKSNELFDDTKVEVVKYEQQSLTIDSNNSFKERKC